MTVLIVEDDTTDFTEIASALRQHVLIRASALPEAVDELRKSADLGESIDLVILDAMFPESANSPVTAFAAPKVIERIRQISCRPMVLIVTGNEKATEADNFADVERWLDEGLVADVLPKALANSGWRVFHAVLKHRIRRLEREKELQQRVDDNDALRNLCRNGFLTADPKLVGLWQKIQMAATKMTKAPVLITGPTGAGKEVVAKAIHRVMLESSPNRSLGKFKTMLIPSAVDTLLSSELFGHVRGAFTGALRDHKGWFEEIGDGTLFLDEIGDLPLESQAKLLRVLEYRAPIQKV